MKTKYMLKERLKQRVVYILPLRNENNNKILNVIHNSSLYPTFKEWKQWRVYTHTCKILVYILPLRNENLPTSNPMTSVLLVFISYL